ncbi:MAG TPA: deoxyribodipyrimidine photo-lyase, partial [Candidatus Polarisedimenticolia bacterium]|nr:deoxyribodipyrimidine photo-lyase [Candidatus Polarisedimenticolia bacterium]
MIEDRRPAREPEGDRRRMAGRGAGAGTEARAGAEARAGTGGTIVWFRLDLRIEDNPALAWAAARGGPI